MNVDTIGTSGRLHISQAAWEELAPEERSGLMARDVYPVQAGGYRIAPSSVWTVKGMGGRFYDFRGTGLIRPNGGRIRLLLAVEHIPVIHQMPGIEDFYALANAINGQGLGLQAATDGSGNACQYTDLNLLCYQARGANAVSYGVEHMHYLTSDPWSERQFRAAAFFMARANRYQGIPLAGGRMVNAGPGIVGVVRKGHVSHEAESNAAGYHDRSDPGPGFRFGHCYDLAHFYLKHHRF